jgi:hypothetical protein
MRSPASGAATTIYLATSDEVTSMNGRYFKDEELAEPVAIVYDDDITSQLWKRSKELTGLS